MSTLLNATSGIQAILGNPFFVFIFFIVIMYFVVIRPQRKRQKEIDNFRRGLRSGQDVITSGGIYGKIKNVDDTSVTIEIGHNVNIRVDKNCVYADPTAMQQGQQAGK